MPFWPDRFHIATVRSGAGGVTPPPFVPADLVALGEWWSVESLIPGGAGPVPSWVGQKEVYTLSASTTARPTFTADDGDGLPAVQFDGVDDSMAVGVSNATLLGVTGDFEFWFVLRSGNGANSGVMAVTGTTNQIGLNIVPAAVNMYAPLIGNMVAAASTPQGNVWHVVRCAKSGSRRVVELDGVAIYDASTAAGTYGTGADTLRIGDFFGIYFTGAIRHALFFTDFLTAPDVAALTAYLEGWT